MKVINCSSAIVEDFQLLTGDNFDTQPHANVNAKGFNELVVENC